MKKHATIAIDIDDVIANTTDVVRMIINEKTGAELTLDHYYGAGGDYWGYYERVWESHGIGDQVTFNDIETEMVLDQSRVPLLPGAELALHELAKKYHIIFITARNKTWEMATRKWFNDRFSKDDLELYFCESHKDDKAKTKGQLCKDLGATWLIDDNVSHCESAILEGVNTIVFGTYGWQPSIPSKAVHCRNWEEVLGHFSHA